MTALINAIVTANGNGPADTINLAAAGSYTLTAVDNDSDGPNGLPSVTSEITINGNGATIERSSTGGTLDFRIFHVESDGNLTLNDLTISNGQTSPGDEDGDGVGGGGIYNRGTLTITNSTLSGNSTGDGDGKGDGGGIYNRNGKRVHLSTMERVLPDGRTRSSAPWCDAVWPHCHSTSGGSSPFVLESGPTKTTILRRNDDHH